MKRVTEATRAYTVIRYHKTEVDWLVDLEEVETVEMTWTEFMKYVKKNYTLKTTNRRAGRATVE